MKSTGAGGRPVDAVQIGPRVPGYRLRLHVNLQIVADIFRIGEGENLGFFLDEEVEGIVDRHVGDEIDLDLQFGDRIGEDVSGEIVAVGVLLQRDEVIFRRDLERVADHLWSLNGLPALAG